MTTDPQFELKRLHEDSIDRAFEKMKRYRLLGEPDEAESICRDLLAIDPDMRDAKVGLLLCLTDQFGKRLVERWTDAVATLDTFEDDYDIAYYSGIMCERRAKAHYKRQTPQSGHLAHTWLEKAMEWYEKASECRRSGDDSPLLRWNSCARMIMSNPDINPESAEDTGPALLE